MNPRSPVERPAGQRARAFGDVLLRVMAFAERKKLHDFAGEILVRMLLAALRLVQPDQHRRVLAGNEQAQPVIRGQPAEQLVLPPHVIGVPDLVKTRGKMAVPEQNHLLLKRPRPLGHAIQPPAAQFDDVLIFRALFRLLRLPAFLRRALACMARCVPRVPDREPPRPDRAWDRESFRSRAARTAPRHGRGRPAWRCRPAARRNRRGSAGAPPSRNSSHPLEAA